MNTVISLTDNAVKQIKKIIGEANTPVEGVIVGVDKSGCSGYAYKLDFAKNTNPSEYEVIEKDGIKVFIEPKATMFLIIQMKKTLAVVESHLAFNNFFIFI